MNEKTPTELHAKIIVLGGSFVGKSSFIVCFKHGHEDPRLSFMSSTSGPEFVNHHFKTSHGLLKVSLWDTVGQEKYRAINKVFYREAKGALLLHDLSDVPNQDSLEYWLKEFQEHADKNAQIVLIGSKVDLEVNPDTDKMMGEFAAKYNLPFTKVSSKKGINVEKAVQDLVALISDKYFSETLGSFQSDFRRVDKYFGSSQLTASKITENKRCCLG